MRQLRFDDHEFEADMALKRSGSVEPPFVAGSDTSEQAAESVKETAASVRNRILKFIEIRGEEGATCDEVERFLGLKHQTASARIAELHHKFRRIVDSGQRRKTRSGRNAAVYVATEKETTCQK